MNRTDSMKWSRWINDLAFWLFSAPCMALGCWLILDRNQAIPLHVLMNQVMFLFTASVIVPAAGIPLILKWVARHMTMDQVRALVCTYGRPKIRREALAEARLLVQALKAVKSRSDLSEEEWRILAVALSSGTPGIQSVTHKLFRRHQVIEALVWLKEEEERGQLPVGGLSQTLGALRDLKREYSGRLAPFAAPLSTPWRAEDFARWAQAERQQGISLAAMIGSLAAVALLLTSSDHQRWAILFVPVIVFLGGWGWSDGLDVLVPADKFEPGLIHTLLDRRDASHTWPSRWTARRALAHALRSIQDFSDLATDDWRRLLLLLREKPGDDRIALLRALADFGPIELAPIVEEESGRWLESREKIAPFRIQELTEIRLALHRRVGKSTGQTMVQEESELA